MDFHRRFKKNQILFLFFSSSKTTTTQTTTTTTTTTTTIASTKTQKYRCDGPPSFHCRQNYSVRLHCTGTWNATNPPLSVAHYQPAVTTGLMRRVTRREINLANPSSFAGKLQCLNHCPVIGMRTKTLWYCAPLLQFHRFSNKEIVENSFPGPNFSAS